MMTREVIERVLETLPEERLREVLDFARFLGDQEERLQWQQVGREKFAKAYGPDEPEYSEADVRMVHHGR
ncbi:MAG: hypothetical protein ACYC35_04705 [Pirellulales bacterium]